MHFKVPCLVNEWSNTSEKVHVRSNINSQIKGEGQLCHLQTVTIKQSEDYYRNSLERGVGGRDQVHLLLKFSLGKEK